MKTTMLEHLAGWSRNAIFIIYVLCASCGGGGSSSGNGGERYIGSNDFKETMPKAEKYYRARRIKQIVEGGTTGLMAVNKKEKIIHVGSNWPSYEVINLASGFVHETTHLNQPNAKTHDEAIAHELEAFRAQSDWLTRHGRPDLAAHWLSQDGRHICKYFGG